MNGPALAATNSACDAFNNRQHRDQVLCVNLGNYETVLQRTTAAYRANKQPALVQVMDAATEEMIRSDAIIPAEQLLKSRGHGFGATEYFPSLRRLYGDDSGALFAIPYNISTLLLYTNDSKLSRAGIKSAPETWEEFYGTIRRLKMAGEVCPFAYRIDPWWWLEQSSAIAGEAIADHDNGFLGLEARYDFDRGHHLRMLSDLRRWTQQGLAIQYGNSAAGSPQRAFAKGECAMVLESSGSAGAFAMSAAQRFAISAHPVPRYSDRERKASLPGGAALWVMKGFPDDTYRAVNEFLAFLREPEQQAQFARATGYLPLTAAARGLLHRDVGQPLPFDAIAVAWQSLSLPSAAGTGVTRLGAYVRFRDAWTDEAQDILSGNQSVATGIANALSRGDAMLARHAELYSGAHATDGRP